MSLKPRRMNILVSLLTYVLTPSTPPQSPMLHFREVRGQDRSGGGQGGAGGSLS
jgi:hypothetical protein